MLQLGISAFYHDAAACLVRDGKVISAIEEERFTEIKHDSSFPVYSIQWLLKKANIQSINDIDEVCWYENPKTKKDRVVKTFAKRPFRTFYNKLKFLTKYYLLSPKILLYCYFNYTGKIKYIDHHLSHGAFSYFTSPYKHAAILTVDGVGEWETITISNAINGKITKKLSINFPNSLGMLYSTITAFLGFKPNEGEYKVMGLAPFGDPDRYYEQLMTIFSPSDKLEIDQDYFTWEYSDRVMFNLELCQLLEIAPKFPEEPMLQDHKDLAAGLQKVYEVQFGKLLKKAKKLTNSDNICLGGGCAYNGVANIKAYEHFKSVHIPFAPSDAGSAIGACLYSYKGKRRNNTNPYLGDSYKDSEIKPVLDYFSNLISFKKYHNDELLVNIANSIKEEKIIALFRERMEFGARALGNRSIIASPKYADMRKRLNMIIKKREGFRPFAPSVTLDNAKKYFDIKEPVPYMNIVAKNKSNLFKAATHIDGSSRVQTVTNQSNPNYYKLLKEVGKVTGHEVLLNTSFNLKDQTITRTPLQAIERFISSEIDILVINNYLIKRKK
tara:strand:- start:2707 stop:4368 length:1662 start_codon:yes stop_codon:yes gene_type:complete